MEVISPVRCEVIGLFDHQKATFYPKGVPTPFSYRPPQYAIDVHTHVRGGGYLFQSKRGAGFIPLMRVSIQPIRTPEVKEYLTGR